MRRVAVGQVWTDIEEDKRCEYVVHGFYESDYSHQIIAVMICKDHPISNRHDMYVHENGSPVHDCWILVYDPEEGDA